MARGGPAADARLVRTPTHGSGAPGQRASESHGLFWDLAGDLFSIITADGQILDVNPAWERVLGWTRDELVGRPMRELLHPQDLEAVLASAACLDAGGRTDTVDSRLRHADGSHRVLSWSAQVHGDRWYGVARDVTEERATEEARRAAERYLRQACDSTGFAVWRLEVATGLISAPAPAGSGGLETLALPFECLLDFVADEDRCTLASAAQRAQSAPEGGVVVRFRARGAGPTRWLETRATAVTDAAGRVVALEGTACDVTEAEAGRRELEDASSWNQATIDSSESSIAVLDGTGRILAVNREWRRVAEAGGGRDGVGEDYVAACDAAAASGHPAAARVAAGLREVLAGGRERFEASFVHAGPEGERHFELRAVVRAGAGPRRILAIHSDVTERVHADRAIRLAADLLDHVEAAVVATDLDGRVTTWSAGAARLHGWTAAEALARDVIELTVAPGERGRREATMRSLGDTGHWEGELELLRRDGSTFTGTTRVAVHRDEDGTPIGLVAVSLDVSDRVEREQRLRDARDDLRAVTDSMGEGLCVTDPDGLVTYLNRAAEELLGWTTADLVGREMHAALHHSRPDGAPYPQEECPLQRPRTTGETIRVAQDVLFRRDGTQLPVSYVSAPLRAGQERTGAVVVFSDISAQLAEQRALHLRIEELSMIDEIRRALEEDRLLLHAQPIVALATGRTVHHELLLRMVGEDGALVPPGRFLPVAERHGLIREIDRWVIRRACELAAEGLPVAVNVSAESFADPALSGVFAAAVEATGADPAQIVVELTETAFVRDEEAVITFVREASALGYRLALDDFGMGYGGFHHLKRLDLHSLKIDLEFVQDIATNPASRGVTRAVVDLARAFGLQTVAEGVEDPETLALLADLGVDLVQGYALGRPVPVGDVLPAVSAVPAVMGAPA